MFEDLSVLLWPAGHSPHLDRRRAEAILLRVQAFAVLFAVVTLVFILVDATVLRAEEWKPLAAGRVAAGAAFAMLGLWARGPPLTMKRARVGVAILFVVPIAFFIFSHEVLHRDGWTGPARILGAAYTFVPFLLACGIGAFPLTAVESLALALLPFAAEAWFLQAHGEGLAPVFSIEAFWLLLLLAAIATFAAMSQVKLLVALVLQVIRDPLTGCLRRESGQELLESQLALAVRQKAPLTVLFADLDRFKAVNDTFGHEMGDEVLASAAQSLRSVLRESDTVLRWGGEEFVVVLPNTASVDAVKLIERLRRRGVARLPDGRPMTLSIGIAEYVEDQVESVERLVEIADRRMYLAKEAGRNRYVGADGEPEPILG